MTGWRIQTYANRFAAGDLAAGDALEGKVEGGVFRVRCPACGLMVQPFVMVDARAWPAEFTGGASFICDGCWTRFEREGRATGEPGRNRPFTEGVMYEWAGAPPETLARMEEILAARRARFADSEGVRAAARFGRMHAAHIGLEIGKPSPGVEIAARLRARETRAQREQPRRL